METREIGGRLAALRRRRNLSLRALADRAGVAVSFLSSLERARTNVSVATLKAILDALGTNLGEFFSPGRAASGRVVYRRRDLAEISGQRGISFREVASGRPSRALQMLVERYRPGADTGPRPFRHDAEEAGIVLRGLLELTVNGEVFVLRPGDAYYFDSRLPHRFRNRGRVAVHAVSVNTPPSF